MKSRLPRHWPLILIASPAAVAIWSGWVGLGALCGFGPVHLLPGIMPRMAVNTAITLPVGVEAYGAYAMWAWLTHRGSERTQEWARNSAFGALALGCLGQVAFHLMAAAHMARAPWLVTMFVACIPVATFGFAVALTHMLRADAAAKPARKAGAAGLAPEEHPVVARMRALAPVPDADSDPEETPEGRARKRYLASVAEGQPLTDRKLAAEFGFSRTWGTNRIREAKAAIA